MRLCFVFILTVYNLFIARVSQRDNCLLSFVKTDRDSGQINAATTRTWKSTKKIEKLSAGRRFFKVKLLNYCFIFQKYETYPSVGARARVCVSNNLCDCSKFLSKFLH